MFKAKIKRNYCTRKFRIFWKRTSLGKKGTIATLCYLALLLAISLYNWSAFSALRPNEWGDFLAGAFGPLALFWLVLGFFQQGRELQNSVTALQLQTAELQNSVEQQSAMAKTAREQFQLDKEIRQQQIAISKTSDLPHFTLMPAEKFLNYGIRQSDLTTGEMSKPESMGISLSLTNYGADAISLELRTDDPEVKIREHQNHLQKGAQCLISFRVSYEAFVENHSAFQISVKSYNLQESSKTQMFSISKEQIFEIKDNLNSH